MNQSQSFYKQVNKQGNLNILQTTKGQNFLKKPGRRANSLAIIGEALGDEGKGRIAVELASKLLKNHSSLLFYRTCHDHHRS